MSGGGPKLKREGSEESLTFRLDRHKLIRARVGDTVAAALLDAGIVTTGRSIKYRRPRGPYCLGGDCGTCLVRIDGLPNLRACMTCVRSGMHVESQNVVGTLDLDPTGLMDRVLGKVMDHHHFMVKPRIANVVMQGVARNLTGLGTLPARPPEHEAEHVDHCPDVLVAGTGSAGQAVVEVLAAAGLDVIGCDRRDNHEVGADPRVSTSTALFGAYRGERLWAGAESAPDGRTTLHTFRPRHVVVATGCRDPMIPLPDSDLPGVVAARGLIRQLERSRAALDTPCIVVGDGGFAEQCAATLDARCVPVAEVERCVGRSRVEAVDTPGGRVASELVALAPQPSPSHDLARQAGARLRYNGAGYAVIREVDGRVATDGPCPWTLWACGDVCGYVGPEQARRDGQRVAEALVRAIAEGKRA